MTAKLTWKAEDVARAVNGKPSGPQNWEAHGIAIDSRSMQPGDLFVALKGPVFDAHDFVNDALEGGAAAAIVSHKPRNVLGDARLIVVEDTFKALEDLGRAGRKRAKAKIIAVTGSVGKTGTKEMLRLMLSANGDTYANEGSFNNQWGVPLSLARLPANAQYGVFELGMNHAGELGPLSQQVHPDVVLITNVEAVHLEFFPSVEAIADAKAEIFQGMSGHSIAVLNRDNPHFDRLDDAACLRGIQRIISFGRNKLAEARLISCTSTPNGSAVEAEILGGLVRYELSVPGEHLALNSVGALLAAISAGADPALSAAALKEYKTPKGRGGAQIIKTAKGDITLIDESYNASPVAVHAAIQVLGQMTPGPGGRRLMALGDMRELGDSSPALHAALAKDFTEAKIDRVYCCGEMMRHLFEELQPEQQGYYAKDSAALAPRVAADLRPGDIITVKGSKAVHMPAVIDAIKALGAALFAFFILMMVSGGALADDLGKRDWSTTSSGSLEAYAPTQVELQTFVNRLIDSQWTMNICSSRFVDVYDGNYRLIASLDINGRHTCNRLVVIEKAGSYFHVVNDFKVVLADNVRDMLMDMDQDRSPELVITQGWSRPETGRCLATWQYIYKWHNGKFVDQSSSFPKIYKARLKDLQKYVAHESDPSCHQMEMDKINRFLGMPSAGWDRAMAWMKSPEAALRRKAATVFADMGTPPAKKNLIQLKSDNDPLVAESAKLYLETPKPKME